MRGKILDGEKVELVIAAAANSCFCSDIGKMSGGATHTGGGVVVGVDLLDPMESDPKELLLLRLRQLTLSFV